MRPGSANPNNQRGWPALLLALCFASAQLLPALHHVLVSHEICGEHGEWTHHAPSRPSSDLHRAAGKPAEKTTTECCAHEWPGAVDSGRDPEPSRAFQLSSGEPATNPQHTHCPLLATSRDPDGVVEFVVAAPNPTRVEEPAAGPALRLASKIRLYRLAPKQSPPGFC